MAKNAVATVSEPKLPTTQPVIKQGTTAIAVYAPAEIEMYDVDAPESKPTTDTNRAIPIIRVLQSNSPQVADPRDGGIAGAKAGTFFNNVTQEIFDGRDTGLYFIPVRKHRMVVEYLKRDPDGSGGGFVAAYEPENPIVRNAWARRREELGADPDAPIFGKVPNGIDEETKREKELVDTYYIDGIFIVPNEDGTFPGQYGVNFRGSMAFQSSFIPTFNSWDEKRKNQKYPVRVNGKISMVEPVMWTTVWFMRTAQKKKGKNAWMIPQIVLAARDENGMELDYKQSRLPRKFEDGTDNPLYFAAMDFNVELLEGSANLDFKGDTAEGGGETASNPQDDIPIGDSRFDDMN